MTETGPKADLQRYLQAARDALLWKLDGLSDYEIRRPAPTCSGCSSTWPPSRWGTSAIRLVGPFDEPLSWIGPDAEPNADMWATAHQSREYIVDLYRRVSRCSDATIGALELDAVGRVPWWPAERSQVTLQRILVHVIAETHRHAGHADIVRELIDGAVGVKPGNNNMAPGNQAWWEAYRGQLERVAQEAGRS